MQMEYKKEKGETYLRILSEKTEVCKYEEKMLVYNPGEGRLEFSVQQEEDREYYCYRITGRKALNGIYAMMSIGERQIRNILQQIFDVLDNGKEYLLSENDFVLLPNYIFATLPQMQIELCCVPGYARPVKEQLEGLFEYLLNRVNYEDKKAVELLYDCYMLCVKEKSELKAIRERIGEKDVAKDAVLLWEEPDEGKVSERSLAKEKEVPKDEREETKEEAEATASYVTWLTDRFFHRKKKEALLVAEQGEAYHAEKQPEKELFLEEAEERTVLLSTTGERQEVQLLNEQTGEVVYIKKFPFYIGSVGKYADYVLGQSGVSRIHCCINKKEEEYLVSDLNSTNGTYLDGKEIMPGKEELLWNGAVLRIAKTEFYVKLPCH